MRAILHLDMDAFYASVEQRDDPRLRGQPVIVGGHPTRGVVLAASYEVRPFGVRSAMPMSQALRLAPQAQVVPPRFSAYVEASEHIAKFFEEITPLIEPLSLDEAFLDITASTKLLGSPATVARRLRERIRQQLDLPASAGIAANKFVAKIASDLAKPNGQCEVPASETRGFLAPLAVGRLWGVGPKTESRLRALGLHTIGDVAARGETWLGEWLGDSAQQLWQLSQGIDDRPVLADRQQRSLGAEDTFAEDTLDPERLRVALHGQAWRVGRRLRRADLRARVIELKLKLDDFKLIHRQRTLEEPTDDGQHIYRLALELLTRAAPQRPLRLTGISASGFGDEGVQTNLFQSAGSSIPHAGSRDPRLNRALDTIADRYGADAIVPADLLGRLERDDGEDRRRVGGSQLGSGPSSWNTRRPP